MTHYFYDPKANELIAVDNEAMTITRLPALSSSLKAPPPRDVNRPTANV